MSRPAPGSFEASLLHERLLQDEVLEAFWAHVRSAPPMTLTLITACVGAHFSVGLLTRSGDALRAFFFMRDKRTLTLAGARAYELVERGELWRHLSCVFLHADLLHLTVNTLALFALGRICEALYGPTRLLALFLLTGLGGSLLSHAGGTPLSVGASGAVFGLLGLAVSFGLRHREVLPRSLRRVLGLGLVPWLAFNLLLGLALLFKGTVRELLGFTPPSIDLLGHLGGLLVGLIAGAALPSRAIPWEHPKRWATLAAGALSAAALLWVALSLGASLLRRLG